MTTQNATDKIVKINNGSINTPKGFKATGLQAGLKKQGNDLGVIYSEVPCNAAAVYTKSHFQAAPLKVTQDSINSDGKLQAAICNSKNANACTGEQGLKDAYEIRELVASKLNINEKYVAVASTGVIGELMPMEKIRAGIASLDPVSEISGGRAFEEAILTTDLVTKKTCYQTTIDGQTVTIAGCCKGSGMIHPNMATMLGFVTTDAKIESDELQTALRAITDETFNRITVDGDTSTNDMVLVMASGLAENQSLHPEHKDWNLFYEALTLVCQDLAKSIARDGEGATKLIEVEVVGAKNDKEAGIVAKKIVGSSLVKTAVFGADANWGRIIGAIGYSDVFVNPDTVDIAIGDIVMLNQSTPVAFSEEDAKAYLEGDDIVIKVNLHVGSGYGKAWGCDLGYDYVKINASYRT